MGSDRCRHEHYCFFFLIKKKRGLLGQAIDKRLRMSAAVARSCLAQRRSDYADADIVRRYPGKLWVATAIPGYSGEGANNQSVCRTESG